MHDIGLGPLGPPRRSRSAAIRTLVLLLLAGLLVVGPGALRPDSAAAAPVATPPIWLPFRVPMKIGCVKSNCAGPYHGYWAIDFETVDNRAGASVYAAGSGVARVVTRGTGCGGPGTSANVVSIDHGGGVESVYVHLSDITVATGTWVTPSTVIGHVGSTGYTVPCPDNHLHYEKRINGVSVNPGVLWACQGWKLLNYPTAVGFSDWNAVPAQDTAGPALTATGRVVFSDGTNCANQSYGSSIAVARGSTGTLDLVAVNIGDQVFQSGQTAAGASSFNRWIPASWSLHSVAAETNSDGREENFGLDFNGAVFHRWQTTPSGTWSGWARLPGVLRSIAAARDSTGRLQIFGTNAANQAFQSGQLVPGGAWSGWTIVPGQLRTMAAQTNRDGRMELFAVAGAGALYHRWQTTAGGPWSGWARLGGVFYNIAVAEDSSGRLSAIATNSADQVFQARQTVAGSAAWTGWTQAPGLLRSVATETNRDGRLEVFGVNAVGTPYYRWQVTPGGAWTAWYALSGILRP